MAHKARGSGLCPGDFSSLASAVAADPHTLGIALLNSRSFLGIDLLSFQASWDRGALAAFLSLSCCQLLSKALQRHCLVMVRGAAS